mmetsp:Transcript_161258/g.517709  ORF Transcript_161258/g.517709 Transcript_161258/m.517709 type:complete len:306 (+) Transcript_161258:130-1047(+)
MGRSAGAWARRLDRWQAIRLTAPSCSSSPVSVSSATPPSAASAGFAAPAPGSVHFGLVRPSSVLMFVGDAAELLIIAQQLGAGLWSAASSHVCAAAAAPEFSPMTAVSAATSSGMTAARVAAVSMEPSSSSAAASAATSADLAAASDAAAMAGTFSFSAAARAATDIASEASAVTTHGSAAACAAAAIFTSPSTSAAACAATFSGSAAAGDAAAPVSVMVRAGIPATAVVTAAASASVSDLKAIFGHNSKAERAWCSLGDRLVASVTAVAASSPAARQASGHPSVGLLLLPAIGAFLPSLLLAAG